MTDRFEPDSYIKAFVERALSSIDDLERRVQELKMSHAMSSTEREAIRNDIRQIKETLRVIQEWRTSAAPRLDRLHEDAEDYRKRKNDLIWKLVAAAILSGAAVFFALKTGGPNQ